MKDFINLLKNAEINYIENEPMKNHTSFKTGGYAEIFLAPKDEDELIKILGFCKSCSLKPFVFGNGSNLLISDKGIKNRPVIHIGKAFSFIKDIDETTLEAGAGGSLTALCNYALSKELTGLEFAFGIPGSCGGAAYMNAGAYGGEMKDIMIKCNHITSDGEKGCFEGSALDLSYRHSVYTDSDYIITSIVVKLTKGDKNGIESKMRELMGRRIDKQPLEYPSAGSVFKRPEGYFAGALIEQSGLKGKRIGGAMVSEKHAGFIINYDNATTTDILELVKYCQATVKDKFGVELETEIKAIE
ncbi:MAG: UDP-N-acetylmuramate dehydrogenase [Acutalibacteraceae bacterium]|nr:UDP-N-acetylmuramate dehydrogenase [Acutalibacteraceae bacterium]